MSPHDSGSKKEALAGLPDIFGNGREQMRQQSDTEKDELYKQIGMGERLFAIVSGPPRPPNDDVLVRSSGRVGRDSGAIYKRAAKCRLVNPQFKLDRQGVVESLSVTSSNGTCRALVRLQGSIGIGAAVTRRPLPHHRAYGSVHGGSSRLR